MSRWLERALILLLGSVSILLLVALIGFMDYTGLWNLRQYLPQMLQEQEAVQQYLRVARRNSMAPEDRKVAILEERKAYVEKLLGEMKVESRKLLEEKERLEGLFRELEEEQRAFDRERTAYREKVEKYEEARAAKESEEFKTRLEDLARMYSKMDPAQAARILDDLSLDMSLEVLKRLKPKVLGQILEQLPADRAAEVVNMLQTPAKAKVPDFLAKGT